MTNDFHDFQNSVERLARLRKEISDLHHILTAREGLAKKLCEYEEVAIRIREDHPFAPITHPDWREILGDDWPGPRLPHTVTHTT
jgi:hypothetical protein